MESLRKDHPDITIISTSDSAEFIRAAIDNVKSSALQGAALAVLVLLVFLRSFSSTLIIAVAIPVSVISTFALMYFYGFTLNTISFGGLALGVGMLVDNAIVVLENIFRHREEGEGLVQAAIKGSSEVAGAVTASTLTTLAVFVPVVFTTGLSSITFRQLAVVVSFSLLCSLAVALTIVPALCSRYLRTQSSGRRIPFFSRVSDWAGAAQDRLSERYGRVIRRAVRHPKLTIGTAAGLFAASLFLAPLVGVELSPQADEGEVRVNVQLEPGTRVDITEATMQRLARIARRVVPEARNIMVESGNGRGGEEHLGELRIQLFRKRARPVGSRNRSRSAPGAGRSAWNDVEDASLHEFLQQGDERGRRGPACC